MVRCPRLPVVAAITIAIVVGSIPAAAEAGPGSIPWSHDPEQAFATARESGRPVLVNFHADWCAPCHVMDAETFGNADVVERVAAFVALKVDADRYEAFADRYEVTLLPTTFVLTPTGKRVITLRGVVDAPDMIELLGLVDDGWDGYHEALQRPADPAALETVATYLARIGNAPEALRSLRLAASLLRSSGAEQARVQSVEIKVAQASLANGQWQSAMAEFDRLSRDGAAREIRAMALVGMMDIHRSRGREADAAALLEVLQQDYPDAVEALGL
jgi:uncharacterized protein YyaL (SSP411 family)